MALCEFPPEFGKVSGTLSKKKIHTPHGSVTRRVFACVRNGKQRIYIRDYKPRTTKLSDEERQARYSFALMAREVSRRMTAGDKRPKKIIWAEVKAEFAQNAQNARGLSHV